MGKLLHGIGGPIQGKVGTVVGSSWNGIPYIRARPGKRTAKARKGEKANRSKFAMAHRWLQPLLDFLREGFKNYSATNKGFNAAKSQLLLNAFEGTGDNLFINPALVKLSYGDLPLCENIAVEKTADNQLLFSWDTNPVRDGDNADQVMLMAYDIENRNATYKITGQFRSTGSDILQLDHRTNTTYHVYVAFTAADRTRQSDSVYLGNITT